MSSIPTTLDEITRLIHARSYPDALEKVLAALQEQPQDFRLRRAHADLLLKTGDTYKAGPAIADLLNDYPTHPRVLLLAAERHRLEGRTEESISYYVRVLDRQNDPYARTRAIDGLLGLKRFLEAERLIEEGLKTAADDPYLLRRKARLLACTSRTGEAAEVYNGISRQSPATGRRDYVEALKLKLEAFSGEEQLHEVSKLLEVDFHQSNPYLLLLAAELNCNLGNTGSARALMDATEAMVGDEATALKKLGFLFNRLDAYDRVLETLGRAFIRDPRDVVSQQVLFAAARKSGRLSQLRTIFVLAYDQHPGFHKLNGLIRKTDKEIAIRATEPDTAT